MTHFAQPVQAATISVDGITCTLDDAIQAANTNSVVGGCAAGSGTDELVITANITLASELTPIASNMTIRGDVAGRSVSGASTFRVFTVQSGTVTFQDLTITNGNATGRNGQDANDGGGGGGGLGAGGGLLVLGGTVTLDNVVVSSNQAIGGNGGTGNNTNQPNILGGDGGGFLSGADVPGSTVATDDPKDGDDGYFGAGGGGGGGRSGSGADFVGDGGNGGFGGGGAGGGRGSSSDPGSAGNAGFFGGHGENGLRPSPGGGGGGGAGLGGGIFIQAGHLILKNASFAGNSAAGGSGGGGASNGSQEGANLFVCAVTDDSACSATACVAAGSQPANTYGSIGTCTSANTPANRIPPPDPRPIDEVDLAINRVTGPNNTKVGDTIVLEFEAQVVGPRHSAAALFEAQLPAGLSFVSATCQGEHPASNITPSFDGKTLYCGIGLMWSGAKAKIRIVAQVTAPGNYIVTGNMRDLTPFLYDSPANNTASISLLAARNR